MKTAPLLFLFFAFASCTSANEALAGETERGINPRECVLNWDHRLHSLRERYSDSDLHLAEMVVLSGEGKGNVGLAYEFMEVNGWVPMANGGSTDTLIFAPPYDESGGIWTDFEKNEDSKYGLLIPCQASWLSNVPITKVIRRARGDQGGIVYEVAAP